MAAYAALVSVMHITEQIQNHPRPPISLDKKQIESLTEKVTFLQEFLENYSINSGDSEDVDALESRIADAAYAAEDIIESHIVDQIQAASTSYVTNFSSIDLYEGLQKVIEDMDLIRRDAIEIKERIGIELDDQLHISESMPAAAAGSLRRSPSSTGHNTTVGLDDVLIEVMDKLTGHQSSRRQIIPIVGMGGIGNTTLAKSVYANPLIVQYFDFRGWVTISQEYNSKGILLEVLVCLNIIESTESFGQMTEHELGDKLYKSLFGRRYLIVMDDIWSIEAWDMVKMFFPDNDDGSRIVMTTRISNLAFQVSGSRGFEMSFLDEDKSWNLLCKTVFGEEACCPPELEEIGRKMAKNGKGLPLSIVVIGGLLARSNRTREHWQYIAENLNSIVNLEDDERCFRILRLSYNHLPVHLKPCFLYMGMFPEDHKIYVSSLIKLWVAEGFLKPIAGKSLEAAAEEYLKDLIDRNLILIHELGCAGNIKHCTIHDLLRDLCVKEAEKGKFFRAVDDDDLNIGQSWPTQRRIGIHRSTSGQNHSRRVPSHVMKSAPLVRSLIWNVEGVVPSPPFRLLRVMEVVGVHGSRSALPLKDFCHLVNSRHLAIIAKAPKSTFPCSFYQLWNLQTFVVMSDWTAASQLFDIWKMPQLRHVKILRLKIPDPPTDNNFVVLENLQTLQFVSGFKFGEEVVKRIPNIKKLKIGYLGIEEPPQVYCLGNLCRLSKLESLYCRFAERSALVESLVFPHSLKKLNLAWFCIHWQDPIMTKIGSLPRLEVLALGSFSFVGAEWETVEGQFRSLKDLQITGCNLEYWRTESTHFPCLERLLLRSLRRLKEIPSEIGDITTLKLITVDGCSDSVVVSAKEIVKEQEELGNADLRVRVVRRGKNETVESLASRNFQVEIW